MAKSDDLLDEGLALARQYLPADDPITATILRNRGLDLGMRASSSGRRAEQLAGSGDAEAAATLAAEARGQREQGEAMLREALAMLRRSLGETHRTVAEVRIGLALMLRELEDDAGVVEQLEPAVAVLAGLEPEGSSYLATALHRLGEAQHARGQPELAEPLLWEALELIRRFKPDTDRSVLELGNTLTELLQDQGRFDEAEALLLGYQPDFEAAGAAKDTYLVSLWDSLADVCEAAGWAEKQADYEARRDALAGPDTP
jgi:tetratricopeptide (TPR) repeat protein